MRPTAMLCRYFFNDLRTYIHMYTKNPFPIIKNYFMFSTGISMSPCKVIIPDWNCVTMSHDRVIQGYNDRPARYIKKVGQLLNN